ncbi:MAG: cytidine deaminase [Gammaproteobacteria bacterium]|nr:MAG: cytidine deaminase [Gammaproteobacteria bacterium]UTW42666.1 cytidine deaminase [bacterium SCSIO 12844]
MTGEREAFELIIGLVGGVGTDFDQVYSELVKSFKSAECIVHKIKLTQLLNIKKDENDSEIDYIFKKIDEINYLRKKNKGIMAYAAIARIMQLRHEQVEKDKKAQNSKPVIYIIDSFKHPDEYNILRHVYRRNFIFLSVYQTKSLREQYLKNLALSDKKKCDILLDDDKNKIQKLMSTDENDKNCDNYGRNTLATYHKAHYFLHMETIKDDVDRFTNLIFNAPFITPTQEEIGMMHAYVASLRTSEPSKQIGACALDINGNVISTGCNEVPKFGGGAYWCDSEPDLRDFKTVDENRFTLSHRVKQIKCEEIDEEWKDSLEFYRAVHAEQAVICDAANRGISIKNATLYTTTFPCHLCAKHIIASGIDKVVYIEPYPKSLSEKLFEGIIKDKANDKDNNVVKFSSFRGVAPKRFKYVFQKFKKDRRDKECGDRIINWNIKNSNPIHLSHSTPLAYFWIEVSYFKKFKEYLSHFKMINDNFYDLNSFFDDLREKYEDKEILDLE